MSALPWLWVRQRRNALRRWLARFRRPSEVPRALVPLLAIGFVAFAIWSGREESRMPTEAASLVLGGLLSAFLLLGVFGGFSDRGIAFSPAEVDVLFPGPFRRSSLVLYHVATAHLRSTGLVLLFWVVVGARTASPAGAAVGTFLVFVTVNHVHLVAALASIRLADRFVEVVRGPLRALTLAATVLLLLLLVPSLTGTGEGARGLVRVVAESRWARWLLYPAFAAADLSQARDVGSAVVPFLGLLLGAGGSLALLLVLQVNFLEASIVTSQRRAALVSRMRRGRAVAVAAQERRVVPVRLPSWRVFRGAGAVLWRNLVVARRSGRALLFTTAFSLLFVVPAFLARDRNPVWAAAFGGALPLFLASTLSFDFRSEGLHMARLKTLPASPFRIALAEVAGSTTVALLFQALLLVVLVLFADLPPAWAPLLFVAYVPTTLGLLGAANLAFLLAGRGPVVQFLLQMGYVAIDVFLLVTAAKGLQVAGVGFEGIVAGLAVLQVLLAAAVLRIVGAAFSRYDVSAEGP